MPDGWESGGVTDITIPGDAGPSDPRIYVGQADPIATFLGQDAAVVFYWADQRAFLISVEQSGGPDHGQLHILSFDEINGIKQLIDLDHEVAANQGQIFIGQGTHQVDTIVKGRNLELRSTLGTVIGSDVDVDITPDVDLNFDPVGRINVYGAPITEWVNGIGAVVNSAAIAAVETVVLTVPAMDYLANTCYRVVIAGAVTASVAPNNPIVRLRKTNAAGQQFQVSRIHCPNAATTFNSDFVAFFKVGAANVNAALALTIVGSGAFNAVLSGAATSPSSVDVYVDGLTAPRTWVPTLV